MRQQSRLHAESMQRKVPDFHNALLIDEQSALPQGHTFTPAQRMFSRCTRTTLSTSEQLLGLSMINLRDVTDESFKREKTANCFMERLQAVSKTRLTLEATYMPN